MSRDTEQISRSHSVDREREILRASEARFRALTERASDAIVEIADDTRLLYASPRFEDILGHRAAEVEGKRFLALIHPQDRPGQG